MIELWGGYTIGADRRRFILSKQAVDDEVPGVFRVEYESRHRTLQGALRAFEKARLRDLITQHDMTLKQAVEADMGIRRQLEDLYVGKEIGG